MQAARLQLDDRSLLAEVEDGLQAGYTMQASPAVVGGVPGLGAYFSDLDWSWLLGAVALIEWREFPSKLCVTPAEGGCEKILLPPILPSPRQKAGVHYAAAQTFPDR